MYLLDSSVVLELISAGKRSEVALDAIGDSEVAISPFTIHEIFFGLEKEDEKSARFIDEITVINYDKQCAGISAKLDKEMTKKGTKLGIIDILIASVAIRNKMTLITFDRSFSRIKNLEAKIL